MSSDNNCFVCMEDCQSPVQGPCKHAMCRTCATDWLERKQECPMCRAPLQIADLCQMQDGKDNSSDLLHAPSPQQTSEKSSTAGGVNGVLPLRKPVFRNRRPTALSLPENAVPNPTSTTPHCPSVEPDSHVAIRQASGSLPERYLSNSTPRASAERESQYIAYRQAAGSLPERVLSASTPRASAERDSQSAVYPSRQPSSRHHSNSLEPSSPFGASSPLGASAVSRHPTWPAGQASPRPAFNAHVPAAAPGASPRMNFPVASPRFTPSRAVQRSASISLPSPRGPAASPLGSPLACASPLFFTSGQAIEKTPRSARTLSFAMPADINGPLLSHRPENNQLLRTINAENIFMTRRFSEAMLPSPHARQLSQVPASPSGLPPKNQIPTNKVMSQIPLAQSLPPSAYNPLGVSV